MQTILRLMTLMTMMLGGHVLTSCDGKVSPASSAGSGGASELAPGAPTAVTGTAGDSQVELTWSAPASSSGASITVYVVQYSSDNGTSWTTFSDGTSTLTSATVTGLTNGTSYVFRVAAKNSNGTGVYSASTLSVTPATTPDAPESVAGTAGNNQVALTWTPPASNGGSAITNYSIQYSSDGGTSWSTALLTGSTSANFTVTGLTNGTTYIFKVAAKNSAGTGNYSENSLGVMPVTTPDVPASVSGTAGNTEVALSWSAPASNGGASITDYVVQYSSNSGSTWSAAMSTGSTSANFTVTGLTNGTTYIFKVAATNSAGSGNYSASSPSVTPATTPDVPTSVSGTAGNTEVTLSWTAPANNGGSAITNYSIQYSSDEGTSWSEALLTGSTSTSHTVTGLTNGTAYVFRVAAVNALGTGSYSDQSAFVTPYIPWTEVTVGSNITMRDNATGLWWSKDQGAMDWDTAMSYCGNLSYNGAGAGSWGVPTQDELMAAFNNGINTQGRTGWITNFNPYFWSSVSYNTYQAWFVSLADLAHGGATNPDGKFYTYQVICVTNPDAPTAVTGTAGNTEVALSWAAPANNGGGAITGYSIQHSLNGGYTWSEAISTGSTSTSHTVTGLSNGTAYVFRVAAVNALGTGSYSHPSASVIPVPWTDVTVGSDITMRDPATGLWWSNDRGAMNWDTAMSHCGSLSYNGAGAGSWRVPTKDELVAAFNNEIYTLGRTGWITNFYRYFLSSDSVSYDTYARWAVYLAYGITGIGAKSNTTDHVVCVRP